MIAASVGFWVLHLCMYAHSKLMHVHAVQQHGLASKMGMHSLPRVAHVNEVAM